jgi:hypothetical protein
MFCAHQQLNLLVALTLTKTDPAILKKNDPPAARMFAGMGERAGILVVV